MFDVHGWKSCFFVLCCIFMCVASDNVKGARGNPEQIIYPNDFIVDPRFHTNHHHHHGQFPPGFQHSVQFHKGDPNFSRQSNDRKDSTTDDDEGYWNETSKYIPLEFINVINQHNVSDLLLNYIEDDYDDLPFISSRFGDTLERSESSKGAAKIPVAAGCSPEVQTIKLKDTNDPSILYIPQCTKVERCSGCCSHTLLSCQPNQTETLTYQVLKTQYTGAKKLKLLGKEIVLVEKHISCKCDCKIKEESCNKYQEYRPSECRCVCRNTDEEKKCYKNHNKKLWNPDLCACQCRDVYQCSTGQYFDNQDCKCVVAPIRRRTVPNAPPYVDDDDD